jgi:WD40 repeat protein
LEKKLYSKHEYAVWTCRLHPESNAFVCGDEVNTIYLYNDGQLVAKNKKAHTAGICDLTFAKGHTLYTGGFDGIICTLDLRKFGECVYRQDWGGTIWRVLPNQTETEILLCNSS